MVRDRQTCAVASYPQPVGKAGHTQQILHAQDVYNKAYQIIEQFYGSDEADDVLAPDMDANQYTFGTGSSAQPQGGFQF